MDPTKYKKVNELLGELLKKIKFILKNKLIGLYLGGSLVYGDFNEHISDIDLHAVLSKEANNKEFNKLQKMHSDFVKNHKEWDDRIEVCYASIDAINSTKISSKEIINISPGEPFHKTKTKKEWLMNWYLTREKSKTLFGPSAKTIINPISKAEFIKSVKDHTESWSKWVNKMRNPFAQSYAILSMCRALYSFRKGSQVSKKKAALWVQKELPEFTTVIKNALNWRNGNKYLPPDEYTYPQTLKFINQIRRLILEK